MLTEFGKDTPPMRYVVILLALALIPSCARASYYDLNFWAEPNFKEAEQPPVAKGDQPADLATPASETPSS